MRGREGKTEDHDYPYIDLPAGTRKIVSEEIIGLKRAMEPNLAVDMKVIFSFSLYAHGRARPFFRVKLQGFFATTNAH